MKDFRLTRQFVTDVQALCNGIMSNEFYYSDRIHSLMLDRFNKYADFDVRILSQEFINDIEVQSLQGIQDAFDVWKESLNNIVIPNYDNISFPFADYGERTVKGKEVLTWIKETCWELREIVADVIVQYNLSNNNPVENFLCAPYYEAGDIGYLWAHQHKQEESENRLVVYDAPFETMFKFKIQGYKTIPLKKIHSFLIEEAVIADDVPEDYFIQCVWYGYYTGIYNTSKKRIKLHNTINEIGKKYFKESVSDDSGRELDYRMIAANSIGKNKQDLTKGNIVDGYLTKLREIL